MIYDTDYFVPFPAKFKFLAAFSENNVPLFLVGVIKISWRL